jgi:hypothetical protein
MATLPPGATIRRVPSHLPEASMRSAVIPAGHDKIQILAGLLRAWGHDADDFQVEEDRHSPVAELFGVGGGVVIVRRRSTGEERLYATGLGSAWFGSLLMDLARGHFAAPRTARSATAVSWTP